MPSFYYADMYFEGGFGPAVRGVIEGMTASGSRFKRATLQESPESKTHHSFSGESNLAGFVDLAGAYIENMLARGATRIPFPAWGRITFEHDFELDENDLEDVVAEEAESRTGAMDIGISFVYTQETGRTQATISLWEDYLLSGAGPHAIHVRNMTLLLRVIESVYDSSQPAFGVLNSELHISIDRSYEKLSRHELPDGNDYVLVGRRLLRDLDVDKLREQGLPYKVLSDGGVLIQFNHKWA